MLLEEGVDVLVGSLAALDVFVEKVHSPADEQESSHGQESVIILPQLLCFEQCQLKKELAEYSVLITQADLVGKHLEEAARGRQPEIEVVHNQQLHLLLQYLWRLDHDGLGKVAEVVTARLLHLFVLACDEKRRYT